MLLRLTSWACPVGGPGNPRRLGTSGRPRIAAGPRVRGSSRNDRPALPAPSGAVRIDSGRDVRAKDAAGDQVDVLAAIAGS